MYFRTITEIYISETSWAELPAPITQQFSEVETRAYADGAPFFKHLAQELGEPALSSLFSRLDDDHPMRVYVEAENGGPPFVWFGFTYPGNLVHQSQFRLATDKRLPISLPPRLDRLYRAFSGFRYNPGDCGGLVPPEKVTALSAVSRGHRGGQKVDASGYFGLLSYGNGDFVCLNNAGHCVMFDHEQSAIGEFSLDVALNGLLSRTTKPCDIKTNTEGRRLLNIKTHIDRSWAAWIFRFG